MSQEPASGPLVSILQSIASFFKGVVNFIRYLLVALFPATGPAIKSFHPTAGHVGTLVTIAGERFSPARENNDVRIDGVAARVLTASPTEIKAVVESGSNTGSLSVGVQGKTAKASKDFKVLPYPSAENGQDGPPLYVSGSTTDSAFSGSVPPTGTAKVLLMLVYPADKKPANMTTRRQDVVDAWNEAAKFYDQASFKSLKVQIDAMSTWHKLSGNQSDYVDLSTSKPGFPNVKQGDVMTRLLAEAAQAAKDDGKKLDDYHTSVCIINLNGSSEVIRGWGGMTYQKLSYVRTSPKLNINISYKKAMPFIIVDENSDWGRCAHELGHNIVDGAKAKYGQLITKFYNQYKAYGFTLPEDVYGSDLVDSAEATAQMFEMMGSHNSHPLFSAFYMEQLGYYKTNDAKHVREVTWDRNPNTKEFKIVAHGRKLNDKADRCHVVKIKVANGLYYYVEVRQRPASGSTRIFDTAIPVDGTANQGGVVVTRVLTDTIYNNQQTQFITLLHSQSQQRTLKKGEKVVDPARDIKITVVDDSAAARPQVCKVKVEWAQNIASDPKGKFDLNIAPWDSQYQTPDIWVDRKDSGWGSFDKAKDAQGRPKGNGDKPRPGAINRIYGRIHNDGSDKAKNVSVTFYSVEPPGVGDNGNWSPLRTESVSEIGANNYVDVPTNWVPVIGKHTCLKVYIEKQLGEVSAGGNNWAQENVAEFAAPASSVPDAVTMPVALRNPLERRELMTLTTSHVPDGYSVHFPHSWVWLDAKQEKHFDLTIIPTKDYGWYEDVYEERRTVDITLEGLLPRGYVQVVGGTFVPPSWMFPIGGVTMSVTPKKRVTVQIEAEMDKDIICVNGQIAPPMAGERVLVDMADPYGYVYTEEARTGSLGEFNLQYRLFEHKPPADEVPNHHPGNFPAPGAYRVQAHVFNSPQAAEASSNVVTVEVFR